MLVFYFWCRLIFLLVGQTPLFPLLCRLPIVRKVFPPIDGKWTAVLESNWDKIREMKGIPEGVGNSRVEGEVRIVSRLLFVRINFKSTTKYSRSKTVCVSVSRDEQDSTVQLNYIYENDTDDPESTDSSRHNGAGRVTISDDPGGVTMEGTYWTDRKWNEGMNTAGKVSFFVRSLESPEVNPTTVSDVRGFPALA